MNRSERAVSFRIAGGHRVHSPIAQTRQPKRICRALQSEFGTDAGPGATQTTVVHHFPK